MWIVGLILIGVAVGLMIASIMQKNKLYQMQATETFTAQSLKDTAKDIAVEIGAGSFNQFVEVKGKSVCDAPLTSELAQKPCVYYSMRITREYEEDYWDTDSEGNKVRKTRRASDTVANNTRSTVFQVEDSTGKISVNPEGCKAVTVKALSRFEPGERSGAAISIGSFSINLGGIRTGNRRTLGYRYEEDIIPVGHDLYVLGEATDKSGEVRVEKPSDKNNKFIVSVKSEENLIKGAKAAAKGCFIGSIVSAVAGVALTIIGFFVK